MQSENGQKPEDCDLGWWPEILGTCLIGGMIAFLIIYSTGIM